LEPSPNNIERRIFRKTRVGYDKFILVQTQRIHYVERGEGEPVILLPGSYTTHRIWNRLMPLLSSEYRILTPNWEANGHSTEEQAALIAKMVLQMDIGKVNAVGARTDGSVVFDLSARYPDLINKIVSLQGGVFSDSDDAKTRGQRWRKINFFSGKQSNSLEERAKLIRAPILYLYGTKSDSRSILLKKNLDYLKNYLPQAWIIALEGGINDLSMHKPEEIADLILVFLKTNLSKVKA